MRVASGIIMIVGLLVGVVQCSVIQSGAQSNIHEIYAVVNGVAYFIGAYILARALENFGAWQVLQDIRSDVASIRKVSREIAENVSKLLVIKGSEQEEQDSKVEG